MHWTYDRHARLAAARDHAAAICEALRRRRCDAVRSGDTPAEAALSARLAVHTARWRGLCELARAEKRRAALQPA